MAEFRAAELSAGARAVGKFKVVKQVFADRDLIVHQIAGAEADEVSGNAGPAGLDCISAAIVFARSADVEADVSVLMKEAMAAVGGRGGGSKDLAQGGVPDAGASGALLDQIASQLAG